MNRPLLMLMAATLVVSAANLVVLVDKAEPRTLPAGSGSPFIVARLDEIERQLCCLQEGIDELARQGVG